MTRGIFLNSLLILLTSTESDIYLSGQKRLAFKHFLPVSHVLLYSLISAFSLRDDASSISLYPIFLGQGSTLPNQTEGCKLRNVTMPKGKQSPIANDFLKKIIAFFKNTNLRRFSQNTFAIDTPQHVLTRQQKSEEKRNDKKSKYVTLR